MDNEIKTYLDHEIKGKFLKSFGLSSKFKEISKQKLIELYEQSSNKHFIYPEDIHSLLLDIFTYDYYPDISRNFHVDKNTSAVIMGGVAFNLNIPKKLYGLLNLDTDDIDLKIYTTEINQKNKDQPNKYNNVMSLFKFLSLICCMFLKQILTYFINLESEIFEKTTLSIKTQKSSNTSKKTLKKQVYHLSHKQKFYGILKRFRVIVEIKIPEGEKLVHDITEIDYPDIGNLILPTITNPDILITTKTQYFINYSKLLKPLHKKNKLTFSDCKIIYAGVDYPSFYTYYLMNNHEQKLDLNKIISSKLKLDDVLESKIYYNNSRYISVKSILIDTILMLSYAEVLFYEKIDTIKNDISKGLDISNLILVKIGCIFKYYKYLIKYLRLQIIRKFYNKTLNKEFVESVKKLIRYTNTYLRRETSMVESDTKNIEFREIIKTFHDNFFMNKSLLVSEYKELKEVVEYYENVVIYLNKSRSLFIELEKESTTIDNQDSIMILLSDKRKDQQKGGGSKSRQIILNENYSYDDIDLDNNLRLEENKKTILKKINEVSENEIYFLNKLVKVI